jgi:hypothetical protein
MSTSQKAKSPAYADHCRKKKVGNAAPRMSPVANRNMWRASFDGHGTGSAKTKDHRLITFQGVLDVGYRVKGSEVFGGQDSILGLGFEFWDLGFEVYSLGFGLKYIGISV